MHFVFRALETTKLKLWGSVCTMSVLLFTSDMRREEHRIKNILEKLDQQAEVYRSLERLYSRFQQPRGDIWLMIFVVENQAILNYLILLKDQMYDLPIALILPDAARETMSKAHKFYPRFITFAGSDYADLDLALRNIIQRECGIFDQQARSDKWSTGDGWGRGAME
jgi:hypothetical protein